MFMFIRHSLRNNVEYTTGSLDIHYDTTLSYTTGSLDIHYDTTLSIQSQALEIASLRYSLKQYESERRTLQTLYHKMSRKVEIVVGEHLSD